MKKEQGTKNKEQGTRRPPSEGWKVFGMVIVQQERGEENNTYINYTSYGCAACVGAAEEANRSRLSATD